MLNLSKEDLHNNVAFLHFLYLAKVNKERRYINRNGKMPLYEERNEPKKGYKSVYFITLRKFMEGYFSKNFKITKKKDREEYKVESRTREYFYGSNELTDALFKIKLLRNTNALRSNNTDTNYIEANHRFDFTSNALNNRRSVASPFDLNYSFSFGDKVQVFAPIAFENYLQRMKVLANCSGQAERTAYADIVSKGLTKLKAESFLRRKKRVNRATIAGIDYDDAVATSPEIPGNVSLASLSTKYRIPRDILSGFFDSYRNTMSQSAGLTAGAVFEFTKNVMNDQHNRIRDLDYADFESLVA